MEKRKTLRRTWIWLTVLLLLFTLSSYIVLDQPPREFPPNVSHSPSPSGVKALYTYLAEENTNQSRWSQDPELLLANGHEQLLIMIEPAFIPSTEEMNQYRAFIEDGNTVLLVSENPTGMFDLKASPVAPSEEEIIVTDSNGQDFTAFIPSTVRLMTDEDDEILLEDEDGVIAFKRSIGEGELIVSNSPSWFQNGQILEAEHLTLVLELLDEHQATTVLFDEYIHGQENAEKLTNIYPKWFLFSLLQAFLLAVLWVWFRGKRFGPILVARKESVRFSDEAINALAAWFIRSKRYSDSLAIQADYMRILLQERWGISYSKDWKEIGPLLERKWSDVSPQDLQEFLGGLQQVLNKEKISKQEFLFWSKKIDQLQKGVEQG
ncbi:DUF4350 domain-containing protein [Bacillus suaedae]|uniref:DUF4350 domain-containing protein n=1 Tax=Halalkalibacter suaedae TaxID=2822140 RepID=A0A940WXU6_9BACI|nr:DUF4350 domain-containing protein [Bacillus suaedae]MBP3952672.1 DUF4350 domain-containing protein [Bacillus suaedae]